MLCKPGTLSTSPRTTWRWEERTSSIQLFSELHACSLACASQSQDDFDNRSLRLHPRVLNCTPRWNPGLLLHARPAHYQLTEPQPHTCIFILMRDKTVGTLGRASSGNRDLWALNLSHGVMLAPCFVVSAGPICSCSGLLSPALSGIQCFRISLG